MVQTLRRRIDTGPTAAGPSPARPRPRATPLAILAAAILAFVPSGCSDDDGPKAPPPPPPGELMPDFQLPDVNPNSATHGQQVSPRQHLQKVSAWYFGHST